VRRRRNYKKRPRLTDEQGRALIPGGPVDARGARRGRLALEVRAATDKGTPLVMGQVVSTPVRKLFDEGNIAEPQIHAVSRYVNDHDTAYAGMKNPLAALHVDGGTPGAGDGMEHRAECGARFRACNKYLGPRLTDIAAALILEHPNAQTGPSYVGAGALCLPNANRDDQRAAGRATLSLVTQEIAYFYGSGARHPRKRTAHGPQS
jgi:hypothetical protein